MTAYPSIVVNPLQQMLGDSIESCNTCAHRESDWLGNGTGTGWLSCAFRGRRNALPASAALPPSAYNGMGWKGRPASGYHGGISCVLEMAWPCMCPAIWTSWERGIENDDRGWVNGDTYLRFRTMGMHWGGWATHPAVFHRLLPREECCGCTSKRKHWNGMNTVQSHARNTELPPLNDQYQICLRWQEQL